MCFAVVLEGRVRGMRRRPSPIQSVGAALLVVLLSAGCADDSEPTDEPSTSATDEPTEEPTDEPTEEPTEEPVGSWGDRRPGPRR